MSAPRDHRGELGKELRQMTKSSVGVFGSDLLRAYKAVGFSVNVAARLQTEAEPGTVLVGFRTYALVKDRVRAEQREPLSLKGAARPVEAWEILDLIGESGPRVVVG
jgi:adenylate cyclase